MFKCKRAVLDECIIQLPSIENGIAADVSGVQSHWPATPNEMQARYEREEAISTWARIHMDPRDYEELDWFSNAVNSRIPRDDEIMTSNRTPQQFHGRVRLILICHLSVVEYVWWI